ncbi:MAG: hypothetical protein JST68_28030 [Bacteroidetes bacterium]|nr:hypothetical protein [Bacteroidota bacterium]
MRRMLTSILLLAALTSQAASGPGPKEVAKILRSDVSTNTGVARFQFKNLISGLEARDSILIIFDRFDHTGAGIVHKVFAANSDQSITVPDVPPGKYYVTIQCIGLHRDRLEKIITIKPQQDQTIKVKLTPSEIYSKNGVIIPSFNPDFADLTITRSK